jgi:hypothetical protein
MSVTLSNLSHLFNIHYATYIDLEPRYFIRRHKKGVLGFRRSPSGQAKWTFDNVNCRLADTVATETCRATEPSRLGLFGAMIGGSEL